MKARIKLTLAFILLVSFCNAQKDTSKVLHYVVKGSSASYKIFPEDNYLFVGCKNKVKITALGNNKNFEVKITNGNINNTDNDSIYYIKDLVPGTALLSIYAVGKNKVKKLVLNKQYKVIDYPKLSYSGYYCDSAITRLMLMAGSLYTVYEKNSARIEVKSFKMEIIENDDFITDSTSNNRLSKKMRNYLEKMSPGSIIYIKDVKYHLADGTIKTEPIFRLFIDRDEKRPIEFK